MKQSKLKLITIGPVILFFILLIAFWRASGDQRSNQQRESEKRRS